MSKILVTNYITQLENIVDGDLWIDETYKKKIDGLSSEKAFEKPLPEMFSVAELVSHLSAWRTQQIKKLSGASAEVIAQFPDYWKSNDELKIITWRKLKNEFYQSQNDLIKLLKKKNDAFLKRKYSNSGYTFQHMIEGLIHHDIYHLGQIGITIKLLDRKI